MIEGTDDINLQDVVPDLRKDGRLPNGTTWPMSPGPQTTTPLWRKIVELLSRIERPPARRESGSRARPAMRERQAPFVA